MLLKILNKLYRGDHKSCYKDIIETYNQQGFVTINFLYLATGIKTGIFNDKNKDIEFEKTLLASDFLLLDGIALQVFRRIISKIDEVTAPSRIKSINGTDFIPYFLKQAQKNNIKIKLILYGAKKVVLDKSIEKLKSDGFEVCFYQDGYSEFDRGQFENEVEASDNGESKTIKIFLIGKGSPLQEKRLSDNMENIKKYNLLTFTVGGLFDFLGGEEKRAPQWMVKMRIFETIWRITTNPKKNLGKFLIMFRIFPIIIKEFFYKIRLGKNQKKH